MKSNPKDFAKSVKLRKKKDKVSMPKEEFVKEHKNLIQVLESPSHKDDKAEAKKQKKELDNYTKKSYDYRDHAVSIDAKDQQAAEETVPPKLLLRLTRDFDYLQINESTEKDYGPCKLNLSKKAEGLFNGFCKDVDGQVVEKFDDQTLAMIAKNMHLKNLIPYTTDIQLTPTEAIPAVEEVAPTLNPAHPDEAEDRKLIEQVIEEHKEDLKTGGIKYLRIKTKDLEIELKKAVHEFVNDFKKSKEVNKVNLAKAVGSWRRSMQKTMHFTNDKEAAKELLANWDSHQESFNQILFALNQMQK